MYMFFRQRTDFIIQGTVYPPTVFLRSRKRFCLYDVRCMHHTCLRALAHCHKNKKAGNTQMLVNERLIPVRQHWQPGISQAKESHKKGI